MAPLTLEPGTVRGLHGGANVIDYPERWNELPWHAAAAYAFGDLNCHQIESRSLLLNGNQLPVDARLTAAFIAANLGLLAVLRLPSRPRARDEALEFLPRSARIKVRTPMQRMLLYQGILALAVLPSAFDVFVQYATSYESTNALRLVTGALLGFFGALWVGVLFDSLLAPGRWPVPSAPASN